MKRKAKRRLTNPLGIKSRLDASTQSGFGYELPPDFNLVIIYFDQKGHRENAISFFQQYEKSDWKTDTGSPVKNWKVAAVDWLFNLSLSKKLAERKLSNLI